MIRVAYRKAYADNFDAIFRKDGLQPPEGWVKAGKPCILHLRDPKTKRLNPEYAKAKPFDIMTHPLTPQEFNEHPKHCPCGCVVGCTAHTWGKTDLIIGGTCPECGAPLELTKPSS